MLQEFQIPFVADQDLILNNTYYYNYFVFEMKVGSRNQTYKFHLDTHNHEELFIVDNLIANPDAC